MPEKTVDAAVYHYEEQGAGTGVPLVLVHGFPLDSRVFRRQLQDLSGDFRVIAPDMPGFGKTRRDQPFSIESLAGDMHALLKSIKALPCVLGGLSMGGYVAMWLARRKPELVARIFTFATKLAWNPEAAPSSKTKMRVRKYSSPPSTRTLSFSARAPITVRAKTPMTMPRMVSAVRSGRRQMLLIASLMGCCAC